MPQLRTRRIDRLRYRLEQLPLQQRLVAAYILILLLPSILLSVYFFRGFTESSIEELKKNSLYSLDIEQIHVQNNMETMKRAAQMATVGEVMDYLAMPVEPSVPELIEVDTVRMQDILRLQYNNPNLKLIRLYMSNPNTYEIWPVFLHESRVRQDAWHKRVMAAAGEDVWVLSSRNRDVMLSRHNAEADLQPRISLFRELQYPQGTHVGVLEIGMTLESFFPNTFHPLQEELAQMVVLDREGTLYRHPGNGFLDEAGLADDHLREPFSAVLASGESSGSLDFEAAGRPFLAVYSKIEPLQAYMIKIVSLEHVYSEINQTRNRILLANFILLAILTLATHFMNAIILKKLHILTDSVKKIRQGDFSFDVDIRGSGEVGELAHHFRKMLQKMGELIAEAVNKQAAAKEAELASLKNQIDSHFLYNTLENIKMMAEIHDQRDISDALTALGGMLRYNMRWDGECVRLSDELNHIANYISIANIRFGNRVQLVTDIPGVYLEQEVLKMSLQPIVENSVKHGLRNRDMTIAIWAETEASDMVLSVRDDGTGMPDETAEELNRRFRLAGDPQALREPDAPSWRGSGIGLVNVHERIRMHYGPEYGLQIRSEEGRFTLVTIRIPYFILGGRGPAHADPNASDRGR